MTQEAFSRGSVARRVLLIGEDSLSVATGRALESAGAVVRPLRDPSDPEIREALDRDTDVVVVISRSDVVSLRLALVVAHLSPGLPLVVSIFDRGMAREVESSVENVRVISMADLVAPAFAGPCLDPQLLAIAGPPAEAEAVEVRDDEATPSKTHLPQGSSVGRRLFRRLEAVAQPFDTSARILLVGLTGFVAVLVLETLATALALGVPLVEALYASTKVSVTVGPSPHADVAHPWFKVFSAAAMILIVGFTAVLTAGLVNRLLDRRLTGIFGRAAVPRRDHAVVVGLGQVGFRLSQLLRELGVPIVAVELNPDAPNVPRAKEARIPVVIGSATEQSLLRRLSLGRATALAAVTSDELENIAISVAARGVRHDLNIALRAGHGDATSQIRALFGIGVVRDVHRIAGTAIAAIALGADAREAFPHEGRLYLVDHRGEIDAFEPQLAHSQ